MSMGLRASMTFDCEHYLVGRFKVEGSTIHRDRVAVVQRRSDTPYREIYGELHGLKGLAENVIADRSEHTQKVVSAHSKREVIAAQGNVADTVWVGWVAGQVKQHCQSSGKRSQLHIGDGGRQSHAGRQKARAQPILYAEVDASCIFSGKR